MCFEIVCILYECTSQISMSTEKFNLFLEAIVEALISIKLTDALVQRILENMGDIQALFLAPKHLNDERVRWWQFMCWRRSRSIERKLFESWWKHFGRTKMFVESRELCKNPPDIQNVRKCWFHAQNWGKSPETYFFRIQPTFYKVL